MQNQTQMTPQQSAQRIAQMLQQAQQECRTDSDRVNDPKAQALFETIAEVLGGTIKALNDYQRGSERVWQSSQQPVQPSEPQHPEPDRAQPPSVSDLTVDISEDEPPPKLHTEVPQQ